MSDRPGEQTSSPSQAPHLVLPKIIDGSSANKDAVEAPLRGSAPSTAASQQAIEFEAIDHRSFIEPRGDGFVGVPCIVSEITNIFQRHYGGAFVKFSDIPIHIRNLWFEEFGKRFRWQPEHDALVRANWEKKCKRRLSDMLCKIRKTRSCPQWIAPEYSTTFQRISNAAKRNRSLASPSHTGGSISFAEHQDRERRSKGDEFNYKELYKRLHKFQNGPKKGKFVRERSRKVLDNLKQIEECYTQVDSSSSVSSPFISNEKEMFMEVVGGMKKGFGLGSEGAAIRRGRTSILSASGAIQPNEDFEKRVEERVQQKLKLAIQKLKINMKKEWEATYKKRYDAIYSWMLMMSTKLGVSPPPTIHIDLDIFDVDDEDDDDGAHNDGFTPPPDHHPSPSSGSNLPPPPPPPPVVASAQCEV